MANEEAILNGEFDKALLDKCKYEAQINDIISLSVKNVYKSKEVVSKEISGFEVINQLLKTYVEAVNNSYNGNASNYDKLVLNTLPETINTHSDDLYKRLLEVSHYIASLSDSKAILLFKELKGLNL